jgi:hypothetical protein
MAVAARLAMSEEIKQIGTNLRKHFCDNLNPNIIYY